MANIDIKSLFSDVLPDPVKQQNERVLQQNEAVNQANLVGQLGGMAAYLAPQRSAALSSAATGLLGIDTRTEAEKALEKLKEANIDMSSQEGLIKAANLYQEVDPIKAAQLRGAAAELKAKQAEEAQKAAESKSLVDFRGEQVLASQTERLDKAAQQTLENANAGLTIQSASKIMERVSPELAEQFTTLFPTTLEGANAAREFALEAIKTPERELVIETVVNDSGIPERVVFDKNDEGYKRVLGVDDSVLSGNAGKAFGRLRTKAGVAIPEDAFNYRANANKVLSIAFNPDLESIVGAADPGGYVPLRIGASVPTWLGGLSDEQIKLRRDIANTKTAGVLPIVRLLAPVTDADYAILEKLQPSELDSQAVWIERTLEEVLPQSLNIMYARLEEEGMSLAAAQQFGMASATEVFNQMADNPSVFREYSLEDASDAVYDMLPRVENVNMDEYPANMALFKDASGRVFTGELIAAIQRAKNYSPEEIKQGLGLELLERTKK